MKSTKSDAEFLPLNDSKHNWKTFVLLCTSSWEVSLYVSELQSRWKDAVIVGGIAAASTRSNLNLHKHKQNQQTFVHYQKSEKNSKN
jgi:hypothetical protein